ncbi:spindle pole body interacting protein [Sparassis latifolia]|uniref:Protein mesA n=1 Tax=Sparassis crispa TaxID=139825 RepID=A0A401GP09_9APHY|nr:Protein mesA [Sparassis crispa]GBE83981.1 Protein mesA [Sparassis crispa]
MSNDAYHCSFVLLADFDIDRGALLTYQFPQPLGTDEGLLANLMLPDGAEKQPEDWTIFFLNQTPFNTIAPVLALESPGASDGYEQSEKPELLYVLNLVRTKLDKTARRGAVVKAMAICTRHPFVQIFKPVLVMALDDYFANPSQDCLARLFDAINSMDISMAPVLTRYEKLIMRASERKDVFLDKFDDFLQGLLGDPGTATQQSTNLAATSRQTHRASNSVESQSSFEEGILMRRREERREASRPPPSQPSPSDASFSLDGSAVWVGDESGLEQVGPGGAVAGAGASSSSVASSVPFRGRRSTDASSVSASSNGVHGRRDDPTPGPGTSSLAMAVMKDSHFFPGIIDYGEHHLPIKLPLATFPEEVGDYSIIELITTFSPLQATLSGPLHPHLHTNGALTPPVIVLFNALLTGKRIIFLGHHKPAHLVSNFVLSACALGSGCGAILRGFIRRAFPYANLTNREEWESIPGFIAGVTNPIFEASGSWDLLCDIGTKRMVVSKDINIYHPTSVPPSQGPLIIRTGTLRAEGSVGSEEDVVRIPGRDSTSTQRSDLAAKADHPDNQFIDDLLSLISSHYGEPLVQARFTEYLVRFIKLASRYEEDITGTTTIGYPNVTYTEKAGERRLGSGITFPDDSTSPREIALSASRIEAWRRTESYRLYQIDVRRSMTTNPIHGFDVSYQLLRLRHAKRMPDGEAELIMRTLSENLQTYDQVTELLAHLPPHQNGLLPLSFGLFHQQEAVRDYTVNIFNELRSHSIGVQFLQALNHFQRFAYVRQAHAKEARLVRDQNTLPIPPASYMSRTPSNRSNSSIGGG